VFLLGPIPIMWAITVAGFGAGPLLIFARQWLAGAIITLIGGPLGVFSSRALHAFSNRWIVFVPTGVVLHDHLALAEPVLFPRARVRLFAPSPRREQPADLASSTYGLALLIELTEPQPVAPPHRRGQVVESYGLTTLLLTPSRPGAVIAEARRRRVGGAEKRPQ
jgi:hypothetical protein